MFSFPAPRTEDAFPGCVLVEGTAGLVGEFSSKFRETMKLPEGSPFKYDPLYRASVVLVLLHSKTESGTVPCLVDIITTMNQLSDDLSQTIDSDLPESVVISSSRKPLPTFLPPG